MSTIKAIIIGLILFFTFTPLCFGESLDLEWNPNGEGDLKGYKVYYRTSSGTYGNPIDVENVTAYELTGLDAGVRYYVAITAYDTSDNESEKSDEESGVPSDTQNPTVTITSPTSSSTYSTGSLSISIAGTSSDNLGVTQVSWENNRGGSGTASGTINWSVSSINLQAGANIITVTAGDAANHTGTDTITINYTPPSSTTSSVISTTTTTVTPTTTTSVASTTTTTAPTTTTSVASTTTTTAPTTTTSVASTTTTPETTTTTTAIISITPGIPTTIEAEEMNYHANGSQVQTYWLLWSNGIMSEEVYFLSSNTYRLEITAKGALAHNIGPEMELLIDDQVAGTVFVNTITPDTFVFDVVISEGVHTVAIGFYNDYSDPATGIDRNLYVDKTIIISGAATTTTTAPTTTTSVASTTTTVVPTSTTSVASTTTTASPGTTTTPATTTVPGTTTTTPGGPPLPPPTTTIQTDTTPPSGSISINNDETVTSSREVLLTLFAADHDRSTVNAGTSTSVEELDPDALMSFSNDGLKWSPPESYKQTKEWTLEPGNGEKTVYAEFRDAAGNWMVTPAQDRILLEEPQSTCDNPQKLQPLSATASSASPLYSADNLIDDNPSTVWASKISLFKKDQFITLDLGATKKISGLSMYASRLFGVDFFPTNFTIQVSQDNTTWSDISSEQGYVFGQALSSGNWETNGLECRYIRIYITKSKTLFLLFKLAQIAEIEVYGCDTTGEIPLLVKHNSLSVDSKKQEAGRRKAFNRKAVNRDMTPAIPGKPTITFFK